MIQPEGHDFPGLIDEAVPRVAVAVDDVVVGADDPFTDPVVAYELPHVLDKIEFGCAEGRKGLLTFDPIAGCFEADEAHEAAGSLFISGWDGAQLFKPIPEALELTAVVINPVYAGDWCLMAFAGDGRSSVAIPDVLSRSITGISAIDRDPLPNAGKAVDPGDRLGEFMRVSWARTNATVRPRLRTHKFGLAGVSVIPSG